MKSSFRYVGILIYFLLAQGLEELHAQSVEMTMDTKASGPVTACGGPITFTTTIHNLSDAIQSIRFFPHLPAGMTYVIGSESGMTLTNQANLEFALTNMAAGEERIVVFKGRAECSLLSGLASSKLVNNNTSLIYTSSGVVKEFLEPNGSDSYSVLSAQLELFVPENEKSIAADFINVIKSRHVTVRNSGLGSITTLDFYVKVEPELQLQQLELQRAGGNAVLPVLSTSSSLGQKYTISDFSSIGDGDNLFEEGEAVTVLDYVKVLSGKASIATTYITQWGCNSQICNSTDQQAKFSTYITAIGGKATLTETVQVLTKTDFCNSQPGTIRYKWVNSGAGNEPASRDAAFNIQWTFRLSFPTTQGTYEFFLEKSDKTLYNLTTAMVRTVSPSNSQMVGVPLMYSMAYILNTNVFSEDLDGIGGLSDVDQDGHFDDIPSGNTINFIVKFKPSVSGVEVNAYVGEFSSLISNSLTYSTWAGGSFLQPGGNFTFLRYYVTNRTLTGPSDLESTVTKKIVLSSLITRTVSFAAYNDANESYAIELTVPEGVHLVNAKQEARGLTFSQQGNIVKIKDSFNHSPTFNVELEFGLTCNSNVPIEGEISVEVFVYSDIACEDSRIKIIKLSKNIFLHCETCSSLETSGFTIRRKTLGWVADGTYDQLFGPNPTVAKVTETTPGIKLNAAYPLDEVQVTIKGKINSGNYSVLSSEINLSSLLNKDLLHYKSAILLVDGNSFELPANLTPTISIVNGNYRHQLDVPLGSTGFPATLSPGQSIELRIMYKVDDLSTVPKGEYSADFRGRFFSDINGSTTGCLDFGDSFLFYKYDISKISAATYSSAGTIFEVNGQSITLAALGASQGISDVNPNALDFPYEKRPIYGIADFTSTLPKGFIFDTTKPVSGSIILSPGAVTYSPDKRTITIASGNMMMTTQYLYLFAQVKIDCGNPDNVFVPVKTPSDIRDFETKYSLVTYPYLTPQNHVVIPNRKYNAYLINYRRPNLQLTANSKQEGYSDIVKWPIQLCNPQSSFAFADAFNSWIAIELKPEDSSTQLQAVLDNNNNPLPVLFYGPRDDDHPNGRNMLVKLGTINLSSCATLSVIARYRNCEENKEQDVNVFASTDYTAYPDVANYLGSVDTRVGCEGFLLTQTMSIKYKTAALQLEVRKTVSDAVDLCVPMNFEIDLTSTKYADMSQLKVWIELPHHLTLDAVTAPKFNYPYTSTATAIPATALLTENGKIGWDVTKIVGGNLPGIRLANNKLKLSFNLVSSCGFDPGLPVKFTVNGYTNCGEFVQFVDQRKVKLSGFELDDLQVQLNPVQSPECNKENDFTVVIKNNGTISTVTNQLEIVLPAGIEYRSTLQSDLPTATVTQENGTTKLLWTLLPGYLTAGEQKQLSIRTFLNGSSSVTRYKLVARTYQTSDALCAESNTSCATQATTGSSEYDIVVGLEGQLAVSMKKYLCSYHFKSNLQANDGCAITSYLWDFGDNTTSNESSPFHAFVQDGTYNVSLNITYSCGGCTGAQSQQLQVVVNSSPDEFDEIIIPVPTDTRLNVLQSSAATFADTWPVSYIDPALMDKNSYLNATQGVWRNNATYAYKASRNQSPNVNIKTDGTYSLLTFNWQYADLEAIPNWIKANSMTQYSPNSYELENKDVLGIYSAALYDYGGHLPSANGANMRNNEMGFTSFETTGAEQNNQVNQKLSGNLLWGTQQLPEYTRYEVYYGHGHMAIVKASIEELANVNKVDVTSKSILTFPFNRSNFIADDNIICRQPYTDNPEWTLLVLQVAPSVTFWQGSVRVKNDVQVTVTSDFSTAVAHSGKQSLHITSEQAFSQPLLQLDAKKNYLLNAWVSIGDVNRLTPKLSDDLEITVVLKDKNGQQLAMKSMQPSGPVIEGWQQIKGFFTIPDISQTRVEIRFTPGSTGSAWYDDLRVHPENGNMKSYVYNLTDYRLQAIMDEENFASFYYYDKAGNLKLVKKETKDGIKTISENSSHVPAHN